MTFIKRTLKFRIQLGRGSWGADGFDTVELEGLRSSVCVEKNGIPGMNRAAIQIYGLTESVMSKLSRVGLLASAVRNNIVTVVAGDEVATNSLVFVGCLKEAWPDYNGPEVPFTIIALTGLLQQMKPALPSSYVGAVDVAVIMERLAKQMGYTFENNGVSVMLDNPYLPGTARVQALAAAEAANIYVVFDDDGGVMAILPRDGARRGPAPLITPETGLVGYPVYAGPGHMSLRCLYNPNVRFMGDIEIRGSRDESNGRWRVVNLAHTLESETPNGRWFTEIEAISAFRNEALIPIGTPIARQQ